MTLSIRDIINNDDAVGLVRHAALEPIAGAGTPIAPSVYSGKKNRVNENAPATAIGEDGFIETDMTVDTRSVSILSTPAAAHRAQEALWNDPELRPWLPGVVVNSEFTDEEANAIVLKAVKGKPEFDSPERRDELKEVLKELQFSSWDVAHRHVGGEIRYSLLEDGRTLWGAHDSEEYQRIVSARPATIAGVSLNSLLWGYWLASGATRTHRRARAIEHTIVGYGASPEYVLATKVAGAPASKFSEVSLDKTGNLQVKTLPKEASNKKRPSTLGLGAIPADSVIHYSCRNILSRGAISLTQLVRQSRRDGLSEEVITAMVGLAILGLDLADGDLDLRSSCSLVAISEPAWGLRLRGEDRPQRVEFDYDEIRREVLTALRSAVGNGELPGTEEGVEHIELKISSGLAQVVVDSLVTTATKGEGAGAE